MYQVSNGLYRYIKRINYKRNGSQISNLNQSHRGIINTTKERIGLLTGLKQVGTVLLEPFLSPPFHPAASLPGGNIHEFAANRDLSDR